jgi:hypothetical protein
MQSRPSGTDETGSPVGNRRQRGKVCLGRCQPIPNLPLARYVAELIKMKETFIDPLLHPFSAVNPGASTLREATASPAFIPTESLYLRQTSPTESLENLPIASRYLASLAESRPSESGPTMPSINDDSSGDDTRHGQPWVAKAFSDEGHNGKDSHPRSPYRIGATGNRLKAGPDPVPFPTRSRQSLPPPRRVPETLGASTVSLDVRTGLATIDQDPPRKSTATPTSRVLRKLRKSTIPEHVRPTIPESVPGGAIPPHLLPADLRRCLEVIEGGILHGHTTLAQGLRKRYEEQYPLVRSLADIFVANVRPNRTSSPPCSPSIVPYTPRICNFCVASRTSPNAS